MNADNNYDNEQAENKQHIQILQQQQQQQQHITKMWITRAKTEKYIGKKKTAIRARLQRCITLAVTGVFSLDLHVFINRFNLNLIPRWLPLPLV